MRDSDGCWLYIVRCRDGSYYTGTTRASPEQRVGEHNAGLHPDAFTFKRRPVVLVFAEHFQRITDAIAMERRIKGWGRQKKEALIAARYDLLPKLSKRGSKQPQPSS